VGLELPVEGTYESVLMNRTAGREQVNADNLGVNSRDGGLHMKKNVFQLGVLQKVFGG